MSLSVDDNFTPPTLGCQTPGMHAGMLGQMTNTTRLEILSMDLLVVSDKTEIMEAL
ncbi:hypothetical protein [Enterobacter ludwigii]|uniref:hypothetical protein n=1 Tax=Enterobacter ludwigii TaxID=299767 RepID=UPI0039762EDB